MLAEDGLSSGPASGAGPVKKEAERSWIKNVGDYLEDPQRHFQLINSLRKTVEWPEETVAGEVMVAEGYPNL